LSEFDPAECRNKYYLNGLAAKMEALLSNPKKALEQSTDLYRLARDNTAEGREKLTSVVSEVFLERYSSLSPSEQEMMFDILFHLVQDVEMSLRQLVSEKLAKLDGVPRELAFFLANDEVPVAIPMLSESRSLLDQDLVKIIHSRGIEHQLAVAKRPILSEGVSDALVEEGDEGVICSLLLNKNAKISSTTIEYLAEESKRITAYQGPIINREELDPELAKRMFTWVSMTLKQHIIDNFEMDSEFIDEVIENAVIEELASRHNGAAEGAEIKLARELDNEGQLSTDTMILALQQGEVRLFIAMFQKYANVPSGTIMEMLSDNEGIGLAAACRSADLGKSVTASIFACSRKALSSSEQGLRRDLRKLLGIYDRISPEAAARIAGRWREHVDYRRAIRELELT